MSEAQNEADKLLAIKDIIFGDQIKQYDKSFSELKKLLEKQKEDTDSRIEGLRSDLKSTKSDLVNSLKDLEKKVYQELDTIKDGKTDRAAIASLFQEVVDKIK